MSDTIIGLDLGHSAVKMTFDGRWGGVERAIFPSLASPSIPIRNEAEAKLAAEETVVVNGRSFFVGKTAAIQGKANLSSGLTADWIHSDEHAALLAMAKRIVDRKADTKSRSIIYVLGLPVQHFDTQRESLRQIAASILGENSEVRIMPQPMGAYQSHMLNRLGGLQFGRSLVEESWAVIDVGYYSTDIILIVEGRWVETASGGCGGVRMATEHLQRLMEARGIQRDLVDAEKALREGFIKHYGERIDLEKDIAEAVEVVAGKVSDITSQLLAAYAHSLDGILVTGGGANMVLPSIKSRWPQTKMIEDTHNDPALSGPRFLVSEGYYRWGRNIALLRRAGNPTDHHVANQGA